jgi:hypothetical protein
MANFSKEKEKILNEIGIEILAEYDDKNLRASGNFERIVNIRFEGRQPVLEIPYYTKFITNGVGSKGGYNPWAIEQWIRDKGILARDPKTGRFRTFKQTAFAIAKKIENEGTDIYQGKREGLYLTTAINRGLGKKMPGLANKIVEDIFKAADLKVNTTISL